MSLTQLAVILLGLYLVLTSQNPVSSTLTLLWGIIVVVLVLLDLRSYITSRRVVR